MKKCWQVQGILIATNAYSTPFEPVGIECISPAGTSTMIEGMLIACAKCNKDCHFTYAHCINATIKTTDNNIIPCIVRDPILQELILGLQQMSYEIYLQNKLATIYMLRDL